MFDEHDIQEFIDIFLEAKEPITLIEVGNRWAIKNSRVCFDEDLSEIEKFLQSDDIFVYDEIEDKWKIFTADTIMRVIYWDWYDYKTGDGELAEAEIYYSIAKKAWIHYFTNEKIDIKKITQIIWKNF